MIYSIFEDKNYSSLYPFNINHPSFDFRCGAYTNLERVSNHLNNEDSIQLVVREELAGLVKERYPDLIVNPEIISSGIWLNGRGLWDEAKLNEITSGRTYTKNNVVVGCHSYDSISLNKFHYHEMGAILVMR